MKLGLVGRARVAIARKVLRAIFASPKLHRRLQASRKAPGLDPDLAVMLALDDITKDTHVWKWSPKVARRKVAESVAIVEDRDPNDGVQVTALQIPGAPPIPARIYAVAGSTPPVPGLVYLHGGGWATGDLDTHDSLCRMLARVGALRVVSIDYRLAPEHPFPAAVEDAVAAFRFVATQAESLGIDPARLAVAGDSAGGNLSAVVSLRTRDDARRPALAVLLYPALDATCALPSHRELAKKFFLTDDAIDWYYTHYLGAARTAQHHPEASPLWAADVAGSPPTLLVVAAFDPLRDEAAAYAQRLRDAGVVTVEQCHPHLIHGFALMTGLSTAARTTTETLAHTIGEALRRGLAAAVPKPG